MSVEKDVRSLDMPEEVIEGFKIRGSFCVELTQLAHRMRKTMGVMDESLSDIEVKGFSISMCDVNFMKEKISTLKKEMDILELIYKDIKQ